MRAIGFCCGVEHARKMAEWFDNSTGQADALGHTGLRAAFLCGKDDAARRASIIGQLKRGEIQLLFVADLLNEGVDIPEVDTVLFLRPTASLTVFLQQLGRGLRLCGHTGKDSLTVLDFIGQHRREFKFGPRLSSLTTNGNRLGLSNIRDGSWVLPPGCSITLEPKARERILESIKARTGSRRDQLVDEIREFIDTQRRVPRLLDFCRYHHRSPRALYRDRGWSWGALLADAKAQAGAPHGSLPANATAGLRALAATDDVRFANWALRALGDNDVTQAAEGSIDHRLLAMLLVEIDSALTPGSRGLKPLRSKIAALKADVDLVGEVREVLHALGSAGPSVIESSEDGLPADVPLRVHRRYSRSLILAAFGWRGVWTASHQTGVAWVEADQAMLMFVTLNKEGSTFTDRTRFRDFAISPTEFHWESQRSTGANSGQRRNIELASSGRVNMWLFIRDEPKDDYGTAPFAFMGRFTPTSIEGANPVRVTGRLDHAMPGFWFELASRAR
jgi:hypothetical protein